MPLWRKRRLGLLLHRSRKGRNSVSGKGAPKDTKTRYLIETKGTQTVFYQCGLLSFKVPVFFVFTPMQTPNGFYQKQTTTAFQPCPLEQFPVLVARKAATGQELLLGCEGEIRTAWHRCDVAPKAKIDGLASTFSLYHWFQTLCSSGLSFAL